MAKSTEFEVFLFDLIHEIRRPKPFENWSDFHLDTKALVADALSEYTQMTHDEIAELFGMVDDKTTLQRVALIDPLVRADIHYKIHQFIKTYGEID